MAKAADLFLSTSYTDIINDDDVNDDINDDDIKTGNTLNGWPIQLFQTQNFVKPFVCQKYVYLYFFVLL